MNEIEALAAEVAVKREASARAWDASRAAELANELASEQLRDAEHRLRAAVDRLVDTHDKEPA